MGFLGFGFVGKVFKVSFVVIFRMVSLKIDFGKGGKYEDN